jgi:non-homologous end joining protein Ku
MVRPKRDKGKVNPTVEQGFALLLATMARRQVAALIKVAMRGPSRYAAILPTGRMVTLHYAEGVRESLPMPQVDLADNYLAMADQLIDAVGIDLPSLDDVNGAAVQAFVDAKAADGNVTPPTPDAPAPNPQALMDSLMASIEANKGKAKPKAAPRPRKAKAA